MGTFSGDLFPLTFQIQLHSKASYTFDRQSWQTRFKTLVENFSGTIPGNISARRGKVFENATR